MAALWSKKTAEGGTCQRNTLPAPTQQDKASQGVGNNSTVQVQVFGGRNPNLGTSKHQLIDNVTMANMFSDCDSGLEAV